MTIDELGKLASEKNKLQEKINILYLEDSLEDIDLLKIELSKYGKYNVFSACNKEEFIQALHSAYDLIIIDYQLPDIDGKSALGILKKSKNLAPAIVLSGSVGEEEAVSLMREGAADFLLKNNIHKIPHAIKRVIRENQSHLESLRYAKELEDKNALVDSIVNGLDDMMFFKDTSFRYKKVNNAFCEHFGLTEQHVLGKNDHQLFDEDMALKSDLSDKQVINWVKSTRFLTDYKNMDGIRTITETVKTPIVSKDKVIGLVGISRDVTRKVLLEEQLRKNQLTLGQAEEMVNAGSFEYNENLEILNCTPNLIKMLGINLEYRQLSLTRLYKMIYEPDRYLFAEQFEEAVFRKTPVSLLHRTVVNSEIRYCKTQIRPDFTSDQGNFYGTVVDITNQWLQEQTIGSIQEEERKRISRELHDGIGSKLAAASMLLDHVLTKDQDEVVSKVFRIIHESVNEVRNISRTLSVKMIEENGFVHALEDLLDRLPEEIERHICFSFDEASLDSMMSAQLYRIIQEAISNMVKHAGATIFNLSITQEGAILLLKLSDNGRGCTKEAFSKGNGIKNIVHRVERCHGIFRLQCEESEGFGFEIKLPVR
ncbi:PAS domain S-box protein [Marinoscillum sp.]|uniref:hybrid sensor histidine kinase/response regulator n=1 Tax=Marinoscillum sp. TaxID=2024838 RepID=UPI003BAAF4C9